MRTFLLPILMVALSGMAAPLLAQDIQVKGYFRSDSVSVGEVVPYVLTATYPRNLQLLFPDSTYAFKPFEATGKKYFPTRSTDKVSYDSVVYLLSTFELDSIQQLRIPIFVLQERDCLTVYPATDSIRLRFKVAMALDSIPVEKLPLKANTAYQRVKWLLNYPFLMIGAGLLLVAAVVAWLIFGKQIKRYFLLRRMKRRYLNFLNRFGESINRMGPNAPSPVAEDALMLWKRYMEELESYPFTKSTSREILKKYTHNGLSQALRTIDRGIYGGYGAPPDPFRFLEDYSRQQFAKKEEEVKHG